MSLPSYDRFINPLLLFLSGQRTPVPTKLAYEGVSELAGLTPDAKLEMLPSRFEPTYVNRIGWAHDALKRSLLSSAPRRGYWALTEKGRELAASNPTGLSSEQVARIATASRQTPIKHIGPTLEPQLEGSPNLAGRQSPQDQIDSGLKAIKQSAAQNLLEHIANGTPEFFERMVLDLLFKMKYGESPEALQHTGKSGDGGVDGIISLDKLGLQKVYIQAKRWKHQVGSPEIDAFIGSLQRKGAFYGVLITPGSISSPAYAAAKETKGGTIVLIDGDRLTSLMIEHGVGVTNINIRLPKIDGDYFDDE